MKTNSNGFAHILLIVGGLVMLGGAASGPISNNARPGDLLYPIDEAWEGFRHALTFGEEAESKLHMNQAQERLGELNSLLNGNANQERLEQAARSYGDHVDEALKNANKVGQSTAKEEVLSIIAEETLVGQDELLAAIEAKDQQVKAAVEVAIQQANKGYNESYGQLSEAIQAQVMEKVRARVGNLEQLQLQTQTKEQTQENKPEDSDSSSSKPDQTGADSANQGQDNSKPDDSGSSSGTSGNQGQGNN